MRAIRASVVSVPTCQRANVPMSQKRANFSFFARQRANKRANVSACQRRANFSTWRVNVPKGVPIFKLRLPKVFQLFFVFQFLNFSIILNLSEFPEYLGNSRKFISRNKELKF